MPWMALSLLFFGVLTMLLQCTKRVVMSLHGDDYETEFLLALRHLVLASRPCAPRVDTTQAHLPLRNVDAAERTGRKVAAVMLLFLRSRGEVVSEVGEC